EVISAMRGRGPEKLRDVSVSRVCTDSRAIEAGDLFFAIPGERFDGHDFVSGALQGGALAAVVRLDRLIGLSAAHPNATLIGVDDTIAALGRLAHFHREQGSADVIAVVGSNGKTTTKAMIHHLLSSRMRGQASPKSFNNAIGVPLTLLSSELGDDYLVVEIGTNAPGEVAALGQIAAPDMVVLTSIAEEHLEGLNDLAGVAVEEASILPCLRRGGFAAINAELEDHTPITGDGFGVARFGLEETHGKAAARSDVSAELRLSEARYEAPWLKFRLNNRFEYALPTPGRCNALNAAGAIAIALRYGFSHDEIAERLRSFQPPPMRGELSRIGDVTVLNDAYNANPRSAALAIDTLESLPVTGRRVVAFGEMAELGRHSARLHREVANVLGASRVNHVVLIGAAGEMMADVFGGSRLYGPTVFSCADVDACGAHLSDWLAPGDAVLLKASRRVGLERVLEPLRRRFETAAAS
ncbi:MAG: UDP-N-acetylmuramoyl-tripeptide--D-alanyl-D-alanine ligase, partial [Phycisphaerales bacterium]|nr:UDP-N-acetylmuramoyl-tripeptide--D-alanyl-D-alanine ligase [Phycisphaerales bacterium]